jgi:hypothetical protein
MRGMLIGMAGLAGVATGVGAQMRLSPGAVPPASSPGAIAQNVVQDGSFESTIPPADNPFWGEASTNFGTPLCTFAFCGNGGGSTGPRTGIVWAWFGGALAPEIGAVSQHVIIDPGKAALQFHLWNGFTANTADSFRVVVDATQVFEVFAGDPTFADGYVPVVVDLSAFADGGVHLLIFEGRQTTGIPTNFSLDDISLGERAVPAPTLGGRWLVVAVLVLLAAAAWALRRRRSTVERP